MFDRPKYIAMLAGATGGAIVHREHGGVFASDDLPHQPSQSNQALASLLKETHDIPIVGTVIGDPVGSGFIKSLTTAMALGARLGRPCSDSLNESCTRKSGADRLVIGERVAWVSA